MRKDLDIEKIMKQSRSAPAPRVKRAVLARFAERRGRARGAGGAEAFLRRPVPLYYAAALVVVAAGLSFAGGQRLSRAERGTLDAAGALQDSLADAALKSQWHFAPRDVL